MDLKQILFMVKLSAFDIHLLCNYKGIREMVFPLKKMKKEKKGFINFRVSILP